jgi:hypothetical protein
MLNLILSGVNGYLEGRTMADVHAMRRLNEAQLQLQFDALSDEEKQRVMAAAAERKKAELARRKRQGNQQLIAFIVLVALASWFFSGESKQANPSPAAFTFEQSAE